MAHLLHRKHWNEVQLWVQRFKSKMGQETDSQILPIKKIVELFGGNELLPIFAKRNRDMPTIFTLLGYRFWFYANDHTPIHILFNNNK